MKVKNVFLKYLSIMLAAAAVFALCGFAFGFFKADESTEDQSAVLVDENGVDLTEWELVDVSFNSTVPFYIEYLQPGLTYRLVASPSSAEKAVYLPYIVYMDEGETVGSGDYVYEIELFDYSFENCLSGVDISFLFSPGFDISSMNVSESENLSVALYGKCTLYRYIGDSVTG